MDHILRSKGLRQINPRPVTGRPYSSPLGKSPPIWWNGGNVPTWPYDVGLPIEQQALEAERAFAIHCSDHVQPTATLAVISQCIVNKVPQGN